MSLLNPLYALMVSISTRAERLLRLLLLYGGLDPEVVQVSIDTRAERQLRLLGDTLHETKFAIGVSIDTRAERQLRLLQLDAAGQFEHPTRVNRYKSRKVIEIRGR